MVLIDYIITSIIFLSCLISFFQGFCQEVLSLFFWIFSIYTSVKYYRFFFKVLSIIKNKLLRNAIIIFTLIVTFTVIESTLKDLITDFIIKIGYEQTNKMLGLLYGFVKGVIIVSFGLVILNSFTFFTRNDYYKRSLLIPYFNYLIIRIILLIKKKYS